MLYPLFSCPDWSPTMFSLPLYLRNAQLPEKFPIPCYATMTESSPEGVNIGERLLRNLRKASDVLEKDVRLHIFGPPLDRFVCVYKVSKVSLSGWKCCLRRLEFVAKWSQGGSMSHLILSGHTFSLEGKIIFFIPFSRQIGHSSKQSCHVGIKMNILQIETSYFHTILKALQKKTRKSFCSRKV